MSSPSSYETEKNNNTKPIRVDPDYCERSLETLMWENCIKMLKGDVVGLYDLFSLSEVIPNNMYELRDIIIDIKQKKYYTLNDIEKICKLTFPHITDFTDFGD